MFKGIDVVVPAATEVKGFHVCYFNALQNGS